MLDLTQKKITMIGAQRSGIALAKLITRLKGIACISERQARETLTDEARQWLSQQQIECEFGGHTQKFIEKSDMVVLSPGVRSDAPPVEWAKAKHIPVLGEIEFAFQFCPKPVIAVTGSNGKTTTVTLIHQVLEAAGFRSCLCGNIGTPFSSQVLDLQDKDFVVVEISSFQLEVVLDPAAIARLNKNGLAITGFKPHIAVILNCNQNHLDRHKDFTEYLEAKKRIFIHQERYDFAVLNGGDTSLNQLDRCLTPQVKYFNHSKVPFDAAIRNPNFMAAAQVAEILKISPNIYTKVFEDFKGVEHRLELVRLLDGVQFINDSKSTTAESGRWALNNFNQPIILICGGRDKNIDFSVLREDVRKKVKNMIVIGEARVKIKNALGDLVPIEEAPTLEEAVAKAHDMARPKDFVVLSPMCTSFDMFRDYEHRGKRFKEIVSELR